MKETITRAAMHLFARKGYAATSVREIAEAAHLTKAALYYHFPDKETLYREAMASTLALLNDRIDAGARDAEGPMERLRAVIHTHLALFVKESDLIRALYHNLFGPDSEFESDLARQEKHYPLYGAIVDCAEAGLLPVADVPETFTLLMGAVEYAGVRWLLDRSAPKPTARLGDRLIELALPARSERSPGQGEGSKGRTARKPRVSGSPRKAASGRGSRRTGSVRKIVAAVVMSWLGAAAFAGADAIGSDVAAQEANQYLLLDDPEGATVGLTGAAVIAIPGSGERLDLDACVSAALQSNARLEAERQGRDELGAQMTQAAATGLPTLEINGNWTRSRDPSALLDETFTEIFSGAASDTSNIPFSIDPGIIPAQSYWRTTVDATWEINPSLVINAIGAARLGIDRQETIIRKVEYEVMAETMTAYYDVVRTAEAVAALDANMAARLEALDITRRRFALDLATALDTLQAAVSVANLRPARRQGVQDLRNAGSRLNVLMGRDPLTPITIARELELEHERIDADQAMALALRRPDIRELVLLEDILRKNRGAQKSGHRPVLSLSGSYGYVARDLDQLGDDGLDAWRASATLNLPLFDGFLTRGKVKETEAIIRRTEQQRIEAERQVRVEIASLLGDLAVARENLTAAELNLDQAEDALRFTTLRYENDRGDYLSVLNAQADRFQANRNLIDARYDVLSLTATLKRAMGVSPATPLRSLPEVEMEGASR